MKAITSEFDQKSTAFTKKLRAEKNRKKKRKLYKRRPDPQASVDQIITLAKKKFKAAGFELVRRKNSPWAAELRSVRSDLNSLQRECSSWLFGE
ncbi:hypothetical protein BSZ32_11680 [Rubritalea profundi]|uniref:Uncharacterized protein n=1 Tax=Rubritalea profundi TaxID=1658618 RepID=A0A2S7U273_9BACT|nr:hypothetical protein BSZ32_11680 [Rubritalea profundi]